MKRQTVSACQRDRQRTRSHDHADLRDTDLKLAGEFRQYRLR
jgi:hypothetical protein